MVKILFADHEITENSNNYNRQENNHFVRGNGIYLVIKSKSNVEICISSHSCDSPNCNNEACFNKYISGKYDFIFFHASKSKSIEILKDKYNNSDTTYIIVFSDGSDDRNKAKKELHNKFQNIIYLSHKEVIEKIDKILDKSIFLISIYETLIQTLLPIDIDVQGILYVLLKKQATAQCYYNNAQKDWEIINNTITDKKTKIELNKILNIKNGQLQKLLDAFHTFFITTVQSKYKEIEALELNS